MKNKNSRTKWTKETITNYIKEHTEICSRSSFEKSSQSAYKAAQRLKLLDELFGNRLIERNIYNPQIIIDYIKEHPNIKSRIDLRESSEQIYNAAYRYNMMDQLFGKTNFKKRNTKEEIISIIKNNNIKNKDQLKKFSLSIYNSAKYFKLFKQLFGESDDNFNKLNGYCVYLYKIEELKAIYVGLTVQPLQRDLQHITPNSKGEYDSLGTYCKKNNVPIPKMEIVKDNLTPSEASKYEEQLWNEYKNLGWFMINSERNLGRLGAINKNDGWTTEKIKRYIKNHKEIKSIDILKEYNLELYQVILNENLLDEIFKKEISENDIYDYITKHPEIHSKTALRESNRDIFNVAKKLNLLEKIFKTRNKYTVENICQFIFEHPEIKSKSDFAKMYPAAYEAALRFNIINKLFINKKRKSKWTEETVKQYIKEHPEIETRKQLQMSSQSVYNAARNLNLLEILFGPRKTTRKRKLTEDYIENYLIEHPEIKTRTQFCEKNASMYITASKLKLLDKFFGIKKPKYTEETIRNYLLEHPEIKTRRQLYMSSQSVYSYALKLKLLDTLFGYKPLKWTEKTIRNYLTEHPEIKSKSDFAKINPSAYQKTLKLNIIDDLFKKK